MTKAQGISVLQGVGVALVVLLFGIYAWVTFSGMQETEDAKMVEAVQVSLQTELSKGMAALELPPEEIHPMNVVNAARASLPSGVEVDEKLNMVIFKTERGARYKVTKEGDLVVVSLKNFTRYHVENGRITRNNQWFMPSLPQR